MKPVIVKCFLFALSLVLCRGIAAPIPVINQGFEDPALNDGSYVYDVNDALSNYDWTEDTPDRTWMIFNPSASDLIQPTEGTNWMHLTRAGSTMAISQITTGHKIRTNTLYRVTFDYAQRASFGSDPFYNCTLYAAQDGQQYRTAGHTLATSGLVYFDKDNHWRTAALEWDSTGSALVGQNFDLAISGKTIIDNVRIEIVPAPPLAYEGFDYASTNLTGANGGYGWAASWKGNAALTADSLADMQTNSIPAPTGYLPAPMGGSTKMANPGGAVAAYRGLTSESKIDLGVSSTYYMSILVERSGSAFAFGLKDASGTNNVLGVAVSTGGAITLSVGDLPPVMDPVSKLVFGRSQLSDPPAIGRYWRV